MTNERSHVDPAMRLGASGFSAIQAHAFFAFTRWDHMTEQTPPFVPQLAGGDDDAYFPHTLPDLDGITSDSSEDSESESFKHISGINVDHLISLARRRSAREPHSIASSSLNDTISSTPTAGGSMGATPPSVSRPLAQAGRKEGSKGGAASKGNHDKKRASANAPTSSSNLSRPLSRPFL